MKVFGNFLQHRSEAREKLPLSEEAHFLVAREAGENVLSVDGPSSVRNEMGHWLSRLVWLSRRRRGCEPGPGWRMTGRILGPHQWNSKSGRIQGLPGASRPAVRADKIWLDTFFLSGLFRIGSPKDQRGATVGLLRSGAISTATHWTFNTADRVTAATIKSKESSRTV